MSKPPNSPHRFEDSQGVERRWRPILTHWLQESGYLTHDAVMNEEWRGIDVWTRDDSGQVVGIDYKFDQRWRETGNVFVEIESNHQTGRRGCILTSEATWLLYFLVPNQLLVCLMARVRAAIPQWRDVYRVAASPNVGYDTMGLLIPVSVMESVAESVSWRARGDGIILQPLLVESD